MVVSVRLGKAVTLECESNAVPPPTITWYKNGRAVSETARLQLRARGQRLEIRGAEVRVRLGFLCVWGFLFEGGGSSVCGGSSVRMEVPF